MLENILIFLFGKRFFVWQGNQEIKKQRFMKQLDIFVGQDSVAELKRTIDSLQSEADSGAHTKEDAKKIAVQIDTNREMLQQTQDQLVNHRQMLANYDYKLDLFRRL